MTTRTMRSFPVAAFPVAAALLLAFLPACRNADEANQSLAQSPSDTPAAPVPKSAPPEAAPEATPEATLEVAPEPDAQAEPTVRTLPSGVVIEDIREGEGAVVPPGATVTIHYVGTLEDGTIFDSSRQRNAVATFPLPRLIQGWQEGIPGMRVGGVRKLTIPYRLAYGEQGRPPVIPPRADLTFEIELFGFEPGPGPAR